MTASDPRDAASESSRTRHSPSGAQAALPAEFYARPAERVARELLGAHLVSTLGGELCRAEIVETEAYVGPDDEANHGHRRFGRTARNAVMFGPAGAAYVYLIYGMHWCANVVTGPVGFPAAVLFRAARPLEGLASMRDRRAGRPDRQLLRGPGNLARGLGITGELNAHPLTRAPLWIEPAAPVPDRDVARGPRVGISRAVDLPLRFSVRDSPYVSAG